MRGWGRVAILMPAVLVLTSACATKSWVRETMDRKESEIGQRIDTVNQKVDSVGQRVDTVDGRVTQDGQRIDSLGGRVGTVETRVGEVDQTARGARETGTAAMSRADAAMGKADEVDRRLTRLWSNRYNQKLVETVDIRFGFDRADLDDGAQTALLGLVKELQSNPGLTVELIGHTDMKGPREYNYQLSQRRVESVRRFLAAKGIELGRIQAVALGPITERTGTDAEKRRVSARLMVLQD